ncbi:MAG: DUF3320 domain-containing protein [Polyangiaceae bacterium]
MDAARRLEHWKQELLDLSYRNALLNFKSPRDGGRRALELRSPGLPALLATLGDGKQISLSSATDLPPRRVAPVGELGQSPPEPDPVMTALGQRRLYAEQDTTELERRLVLLGRDARLSQEELGLNTLFLALGSVLFPEAPGSDKLRRAPLLLVPVELKRKGPTSAFKLSASDEDAVFNITLLEKFKRDFGLELPELQAELPSDEQGIRIDQILTVMQGALPQLPGARIEQSVYLTHFFFTKFLMWRDLDAHTERLLASPLVTALASGHPLAGQGTESSLPLAEELDQTFKPLDLTCVYDADSSQMAALAAAHTGRSFVLEGPPGTGKSQTITNLIAHFLNTQRSVLFVSEKRAALDVVQRRLSAAGLGRFCLELHSHKAGKAQVVKQLAEAFEAEAAEASETLSQALAREVADLRTELNRYAGELHRERDGGFSVFEILGRRSLVMGAPRIEHRLNPGLGRAALAQLLTKTRTFKERVQAVGALEQHPLRGSRLSDWDPQLHERVRSQARQLGAVLQQTQQVAQYLCAPLGQPAPSSLSGLIALNHAFEQLITCPNLGPGLISDDDHAARSQRAEQLAQMCSVSRDDEAYLGTRYAMDRLFALDLSQLREKLQQGNGVFSFVALWGVRKQLEGAIKMPALPSNTQLLADVTRAERFRSNLRELNNFAPRAVEFLGGNPTDWRYFPEQYSSARNLARDLRGRLARLGLSALGDSHGLVQALSSPEWARQRDWLKGEKAKLHTGLAELNQLSQGLARELGFELAVFGAPEDPQYLSRLSDLAARWQGLEPQALRDFAQLNQTRVELDQAGLDQLTRAVLAGTAPGPLDQLELSVERAFYEAWLSHDAFSHQLLSSFRGRDHETKIARFRTVDTELVRDTQARVAATLSARKPALDGSDESESGVLRREIRKQRQHLAIRRLFQKAPNALRRLKPCVMMSPLSVARYLDIHGPQFDLVVFDEASQVSVHDAIGALARAKQAVVVGDSKQMPPTNFFMKKQSESDSEDDLPDDLESILDECAAAGLPALSLRWHYRSRDESLIAFSNARYYGSALFTFPGPVADKSRVGVSYQRVAGVYDRGGSRTNRVEAEALVAEVVERLKRGEDKSFGVVTFNQPQQILVEDLLEAARRAHPEIERYFSEDTLEPVFVKNLENVQGDERDVILFSICYGNDPAGKFFQNFGPLNLDGGQRRLNVAVTRAREQLKVFASIGASDIGPSEAKGSQDLKLFLDYAERGAIALTGEARIDLSQDRFGSPLEREVCLGLRGLGHTVHTQIGVAGYRVDLAIVDPAAPGRYLLGIECDGAMYHSAKVARDRDRIRGTVLERLGWQLRRVWSSDWWLDSKRELSRLHEAILDLQAQGSEPAASLVPPTEDAPKSKASPTLIGDDPAPPGATVLLPAPGEMAPDTSLGAVREVYVVTKLKLRKVEGDAFYEQDAELVADITRIIHTESPVSVELLTKRLLSAWPQSRVTSRVTQRVDELVDRVVQASPMEAEGNILYRHGDPLHQLTRYRPLTDSDGRELADVPVLELAAAALAVLQRDISLPREELAKQTALEMGLSRSGKASTQLCDQAVEVLLARGKARIEQGQVVLV